jgi:hypothetical protein
MKKFALFVVGALVFSTAALAVGFAAGGDDSLRQGAIAFALTFPPAAAALAWVLHSYRGAPELQLLASLGGSGLRMGIALGGGLLLTSYQAQSFDRTFWCWLILFYLGLLAFEITLLVWQPL